MCVFGLYVHSVYRSFHSGAYTFARYRTVFALHNFFNQKVKTISDLSKHQQHRQNWAAPSLGIVNEL